MVLALTLAQNALDQADLVLAHLQLEFLFQELDHALQQEQIERYLNKLRWESGA